MHTAKSCCKSLPLLYVRMKGEKKEIFHAGKENAREGRKVTHSPRGSQIEAKAQKAQKGSVSLLSTRLSNIEVRNTTDSQNERREKKRKRRIDKSGPPAMAPAGRARSYLPV
jgi:hypothetical protein